MRLRTLIFSFVAAGFALSAVGSLGYSIWNKYRIDGTYQGGGDPMIRSATLSVDGDKGHLHVEYISQVMDVDVKVENRDWLKFSVKPVGPDGKFIQFDFIKDYWPLGFWACPDCMRSTGPGPVGLAPVFWAKQ